MRAGKLDITIHLQKPVDTADGKGGQSREWVTVETRRAEEVHQGSKVFHSVSQRHTQATHMFNLRPVDVQPEYRLLYNDEPHRIVGIDTYHRRIRLITEREQRTKTYGH